MPIEREFKYVLRDPDDLWYFLSPLEDSGLISGRVDIEQSYLSKGSRVRKRSWSLRNGKKCDEVEWIFTYKHSLSSQPGCLEIETKISEEDFLLAWEESTNKIIKTRFILPCYNTSGVWEIDFFKDDQGIFFALAEFEVSAKAGPPNSIHPLVEKFLTYSVQEGDSRFNNRKLGDRTQVQKLLQEIA